MTKDAEAIIKILNEQTAKLKAKGWDKDEDAGLKYITMSCLECYRKGVEDGKAAAAEKDGK